MYSRAANLFRFSVALYDVVVLNIVQVILLLTLSVLQDTRPYVLLIVVSNFAWLLATYITALYVGKEYNHEHFFKKTVQSTLIFFLLILSFIFLSNYQFSRIYISLNLLAFSTLLIITRSIYISADQYLKKKNLYKKEVLIIGNNDLSGELIRNFKRNVYNIQVKGFFDDTSRESPVCNHSYLGNIASCLNYAREHSITEIYCVIAPEDNKELYRLAEEAERQFIRFRFVPNFKSFVNRKMHVDFISNIPVLSLRAEPLERIDAQVTKRAFDIIFSLMVIVLLLSWLVPFVALLVKLSSRGPVFFKQLRSGKNNQPFLCYKFRSLHVNNDAHTVQVSKDDKRYTLIGKFLRKSNLDELPQFLNVLKGDMSVVGPRPHMLKHTDEYGAVLEQYLIRHYIKPGITGLAQVNGYRGEIKNHDQLKKRIDYDLYYLEQWSMLLDLKVIMQTVFKAVKGDENAY